MTHRLRKWTRIALALLLVVQIAVSLGGPITLTASATRLVQPDTLAASAMPLGSWRASMGAPPGASPPLVYENVVVIHSSVGDVTALDVSTGAVAWHIPSAALAALTPDAQEREYDASDDPLATLPNAGEIENALMDSLRASGIGAPVAAGGLLFTTATGGAITGRSLVSGEERWSLELPAPLVGSVGVDDWLIVGHRSGLYGINAETGQGKWWLDLGGSLTGAPLALPDSGDVAVAVGANIYRVDAADGHVRWSIALANAVSAPLSATSDLIVTGLLDGTVVGINAATGNISWRFTTPASISAAPLIRDDHVIVTSQGGGVYALDLATGQPQAIAATGMTLSLSPVRWNDLIVTGGATSVLGLDAASLQQRWVLPIQANSVTNAEEQLLVVTESGDVIAFAVPDDPFFADRDPPETQALVPGGVSGRHHDPGPGPMGNPTLLWSALEGLDPVMTAVSDGYVVTVGIDSVIYAVDLATGQTLWRYGTTSRTVEPPIIHEGTVIASFYDGWVHGLSLSEGQPLWSRDDATGQPNAANGWVYLPVESGLIALDSATGDERWSITGEYSAIVLNGDALYVSEYGQIVQLDPSNGDEVWTVEHNGTSLTAADSVLLEYGNAITTFDPAIGRQWYTMLIDARSIAVGHGVGYAQVGDDHIIAFDPITGAIRWETTLDLPNMNARGLTLAEGVLYATYAGVNPTLVALNRTGGVLWTWDAPDVTSGAIASPPVVVDGVAIISLGGALYAITGADNPSLPISVLPDVDPNSGPSGPDPIAVAPLAIAGGNVARTGVYPGEGPATEPSLRWEFPTGNQPRSTPVIAGGTVYVGGETQALIAIGLVSGEEQWRYTASTTVSPPTVSNGLVFFAADRELIAVDAATGEVHLQRPGDFNGSLLIISDVAIASTSGGVVAYDLAGERTLDRWSVRCQIGCSEPAAADGVVYVTDWTDVVALDLATGVELWRVHSGAMPKMGGEQLAPAVADGVVYVALGKNALAFDAMTGEALWSVDLGDWATSPAAVSVDTIVIGTDFGEVVGLEREDGDERWRYDTRDTVKGQPAISGNIVYVTSYQGTLTALDLATGEQHWIYDVGPESHGGATVGDDVVVATFGGTVIALNGAA